MGSNGAYYKYPGVPYPSGPNQAPGIQIPPDQGGGCVTSGPFANISVNLGPVLSILDNVPKNPQPDGLGYNPRCLRRDLNKYAAAVTGANYTYTLITTASNIDLFQNAMQGGHPGDFFLEGRWGVHGGGHFTTGGDPGGVSQPTY
jgi:tyrosinase